MNAKDFRAKIKTGKKLVQEKKQKQTAAEEDDLLKETKTKTTDSDGESEEIKIDFVFCDSRGEDDEMWIRTLLQKGWTGKCVLQNEDAKLRKLGKSIAEQIVCGTFIKTEDDDAIYAFMTVLDAAQNMPSGLLAKIDLPANSGKVGWLVRERIVNIPEDTTYPLLKCLVDDLEFAEKEDAATMQFDTIVLLAPCFKTGEEEEAPAGKKKQKKQRLMMDATVDYCLFEDAVFANSASSSTLLPFSRPTVADDVDEMPDDNLPLHAKALVLSKQAFISAVAALEHV